MVVRKLIAGAGAAAMLASSAMAANAAVRPVSVVTTGTNYSLDDERTGADMSDSSKFSPSTTIIVVLAAAAVVGGIIIAVDEDDEAAVSPY
ncbi:hypothetical protein [Stakelama tenebrarum]|uniref:Secreted protein n=1 Tax=Stakelama tenebrarum TaxID=2711215 RepID=A0A6G6Y4M2_9SPHN|nr:hypothetical protein [Sphingosinithalassobacter tenebrarum]QIG79553.1 hypothetical protein G5C33_06950 [Sphingosinithalassobacter tenebrarum]